jgi:hypothetical protein
MQGPRQNRHQQHHHNAQHRRKADRGSHIIAIGLNRGATAAMAELPQIALPQATNSAIRPLSPSQRPRA